MKKIIYILLSFSLFLLPVESFAGKSRLLLLIQKLEALITGDKDDVSFQSTLDDLTSKLKAACKVSSNRFEQEKALKLLATLHTEAQGRRNKHLATAQKCRASAQQALVHYEASQLATLNLKKERAEATLKKENLKLEEMKCDLNLLVLTQQKLEHSRSAEALHVSSDTSQARIKELAQFAQKIEDVKKLIAAQEQKIQMCNQELEQFLKKLAEGEEKYGSPSASQTSSSSSTAKNSTNLDEGTIYDLGLADILQSSGFSGDYRGVIGQGQLGFSTESTAELLFSAYTEFNQATIALGQYYKAESDRRSSQSASTADRLDPVLSSLTTEALAERNTFCRAKLVTNLNKLREVFIKKAEGLVDRLNEPTDIYKYVTQTIASLKQLMSEVAENNKKVVYHLQKIESLLMKDDGYEGNELKTLVMELDVQLLSMRFDIEEVGLYFTIIKVLHPYLCVMKAIGNAHVKSILISMLSEFEAQETTHEIFKSSLEQMYKRYGKLVEASANFTASLGKQKKEYANFLCNLTSSGMEESRRLAEQTVLKFRAETANIIGLATKLHRAYKSTKGERKKEETSRRMKAMFAARKAAQEAELELELELELEHEAAASQSSSTSSFSSRPSNDVERYVQWFYQSEVNYRKENRELLEAQRVRDDKKAAAKSSKNHEAATSSTSSGSNDDQNEVVEKPLKKVKRRVYELFVRILEEKNTEFTIEEVQKVIEALGGYANHSCAGDRVKLALRHLGTGQHNATVIHSHLQYGHKGLEGGRMSSVRKLLENAGCTLETIVPDDQVSDDNDDD